jgi:DNA-binding transcriptional LysR family regulator
MAILRHILLIFYQQSEDAVGSQDEIRVFTTVVDHAGFAPAAKSLDVTRSAICRRIDRLEKRLGVRLLDRTTRRITLTDAGEALYQRSVRILADIAEAELIASEYGGAPQGVLKVTSPIIIGLHKLIPLLPEFLGQHSQVKVQLDLSDDTIDPALTDHDVAIRWDAQQSSAMIITRLAASRQIICATPSYLHRHGTPKTPHDLARHNCLLMSRLGLAHNEWSFRSPDGPISVKVSGNFVVNGGHGNYQALIGGLGVGRVTDLRAMEDVNAGRLRHILKEFEPADATPIYAAYKRGPLVPPKVRSFIDFLRESMRPSSEAA